MTGLCKMLSVYTEVCVRVEKRSLKPHPGQWTAEPNSTANFAYIALQKVPAVLVIVMVTQVS